jgi:hypothetical protein
MPFVGLEPTIPASERAKTVHALDCSATQAGSHLQLLMCNAACVFTYFSALFSSYIRMARS